MAGIAIPKFDPEEPSIETRQMLFGAYEKPMESS